MVPAKKMVPGPILQERGHSQLEDITENGAWHHFFCWHHFFFILQERGHSQLEDITAENGAWHHFLALFSFNGTIFSLMQFLPSSID